jgi:hypothetical protein
MTLNRKQEERFLSQDERDLVARSHQPEIAALSDADLASLRKLLRERRDRATDIARRQRRELRGKARPQGADPARDDTGSKLKQSLLAQAMKRLNSEATRRRKKAARGELAANMRRALAMKQAAARPSRPKSRTAGKGMKSRPSGKSEQIADPREAGRVSQAGKQAQARRDG